MVGIGEIEMEVADFNEEPLFLVENPAEFFSF